MTSLNPSTALFDRIISYRYYRLQHLQSHRSASATGYVRSIINCLDLPLKEHTFLDDGPSSYSIFPLALSRRPTRLALPRLKLTCRFLTGHALRQYIAIRNASHAPSGGVASWSEAVQCLLRTTATPSATREALTELRSLKTLRNEDEIDLLARLYRASYRCGIFHSEADKITFDFDGLLHATRTIMDRYRENQLS